MKRFTEVCNRHGTDKGTMVRECHGYSETYDDLFQPYLNRNIKILEIGISDPLFPGASLRAYYEYFPDAKIYGLDIVNCKHFDNDRVTTFQGDTLEDNTYPQVIKEGNYDIIIDDGHHNHDHHMKSFKFLFPALNSGGIYIIEDLHASTSYLTRDYLLDDKNKEELKVLGVKKVALYCNNKVLVIDKK